MIKDAGLGLRRSFLYDIYDYDIKPNWFEIAPENWIKRGGPILKQFEKIRSDFPIACHGLSLSIGSPDPLDFKFLEELKQFLDYYQIDIYSEHLSFSMEGGKRFYDLLPLPFTKNMAEFVSEKIMQVQDYLKRPLILENISYYLTLEEEISELEFINYILEKTGAYLLLDVNNVYVNDVNHGYDPKDFIKNIKLDRVKYMHIAGHLDYKEDLLVDTHGEKVKDDVWDLLEFTLDLTGNVPVLLERDNNIPPYQEILEEYKKLESIIKKVQEKHARI